MPKRKRRKFTAEQKADAVRLAREVGSIPQVARDLDLTESALRHWENQADIDEGHGPEGALTTEQKAEIRRLRREGLTLKMERDFLRKPRPSSPRSRIGLRADRGGEGQLPDCSDVPCSQRLQGRIVRLASTTATNRPRQGRLSTPGTDPLGSFREPRDVRRSPRASSAPS